MSRNAHLSELNSTWAANGYPVHPESKTCSLIPIIRPEPPRLSEHAHELAQIEALGKYTNYGPVNSLFERELVSSLFQTGECLTVCNATIGLMLAIREVIGDDRPSARRYALMPSFTFAATAQAALWCGLTPLLCDIDPETWLPDGESEEALLQQYAGEIAVIVPYATFGNCLDLARYQRLSEIYSVPIVVDAAASLGSLDTQGGAFGRDFAWPMVFSMHATKAFAVGEGGIIYCGERERMARLRCMGSFGFEEGRSATLPGLNSKLSEVTALTALLQLRAFPDVIEQRGALSASYRVEFATSLPMQRLCGSRQVQSFESVLLPPELASKRDEIKRRLQARHIGTATYFSPHLAEQPYIRKHAVLGPLSATQDVAARILSLPVLTGMLPEQVREVATAVHEVVHSLRPRVQSRPTTLTWPVPVSHTSVATLLPAGHELPG